jgi:hypothetical protein
MRAAAYLVSARVIAMPTNLPDVHAGRPRAGRRFEPIAERMLSESALRAARTLPGAHRGVRILLETAGPFGVPDRRLALEVPPLLNQVDAGVISATAPAAARTLETLAKRLSWPVETVQRRLPHLLRIGALVRAGAETYVRPADLASVGRLFAIEAKVRDWRRALRQARTYSVWTDGYVIVMPEVGASSLPGLLAEVSRDRGGLMLNGKWVLRPRLLTRTPAQRLWGSEHAIAAFDPG